MSKKREIVELVKLKPDFVVAAFAGGEAAIFVRDYFRFKVHEKFPLVMPGPAFSDSLLKKYSDTLEQYGTGVDVVSADTYFSSQKNTANQRFVADYQQAYKKLPDAFSIGGYDAGWLLIKALVQLQGQWDGQKIVQLMRTLPYISPRHGRQLQFDTHGDVMNSAYIFKTKRDGNRLVSEILGQVPPMNTDKMLK